jgi:hypothetical protein
MSPEEKDSVDEAIEATELHDLPTMTVKQHHCFCVGVLASCHDYVPAGLQRAIEEAMTIIRDMGLEIDAERFIAERKAARN